MGIGRSGNGADREAVQRDAQRTMRTARSMQPERVHDAHRAACERTRLPRTVRHPDNVLSPGAVAGTLAAHDIGSVMGGLHMNKRAAIVKRTEHTHPVRCARALAWQTLRTRMHAHARSHMGKERDWSRHTLSLRVLLGSTRNSCGHGHHAAP